jgi:hypothetical protein
VIGVPPYEFYAEESEEPPHATAKVATAIVDTTATVA